jgi:hypothetical protein
VEKIKYNNWDIDANEEMAIVYLDNKEVDRIDLSMLVQNFLVDSNLYEPV